MTYNEAGPVQSVYSLPRNTYEMIVTLTGPDDGAVPGGLTVAYTRNHALAAFASRYVTVHWKPWLKPEKPVRCDKAGTDLKDTLGNVLAVVEIDPDSPLGIRTAWVSPEVLADIAKGV